MSPTLPPGSEAYDRYWWSRASTHAKNGWEAIYLQVIKENGGDWIEAVLQLTKKERH
jgi:hypothetical protein